MLATLLVALVAIIHLAILVLEMFLWEGSAGRRAFNLSADFARQTRVLAANQGLYNGFLAAGLAWGLWLGAPGGAGGYLFPGLRAGRRDFRRADRQPQNSLYSSAARAAGAGCRADASVGP